jgi:hypothetical protein
MNFHEEQARKYLDWIGKVTKCPPSLPVNRSRVHAWALTKDFNPRDEWLIFQAATSVVREMEAQRKQPFGGE